MTSLIKKDLVEAIHTAHVGMSLAEAHHYVTELLSLLTEAFERGERVTIKDFGSFRRKQLVSRTIQLPDGTATQSRSGEKIQFIPAPALKTKVNIAP